MVISNLDKLHYGFCQDLGDKATIETKWPTKINFALFKVKQLVGGAANVSLNDIDWTRDIQIPGIYEVQRIYNISEMFNIVDKEYQTFIAPSDYSQNEFLYVRGNDEWLFVPIPNKVFQHPHLPVHATFQFYFLNNSLFTANLPYLEIGDFQGNGDKQIRIRWVIKANPSGTYVFFRSGHIFFKWKIEVRQGIVNMSLVKVAIDGISQSIKGAGKALGSFFGINTDGIDKAKEEITGNLVGKDRGGGFMERERSQRVQELQTQRMFTSTLQHTGDQVVEPAIFYANTVKFPYNLFDFWLRTENEPFICRFHYSNNLLNNLIHNNDINPITYPLDITFVKLGNILRAGFIQGRIDLDYDSNGRMAEAIARGVTFYEDKKKHFINPNLGVKEAVNSFQYSSFGASQGYTAQAITEGGEGLTIDIPYTADQRGYSHTTFIKLTDNSVMNDFKDAIVAGCNCSLGALHYSNSQGFCWGCTYDELKRVGFVSIKFTPVADCSVILNLEVGSGGANFNLKAGTEYEVTISETQFIFKSEGSTKLITQNVVGSDNFLNLDFTPPPGSGGDIEIPLEDPEIALPEPGEDIVLPEDDFTPDPFDPSAGEPEIPPIEPDLPADIDQGLDIDQGEDIDPPPIEIDVPTDQDTSQDQDTSRDQDTGDYDVPPPDPFDRGDDDAD